MGLAKEVLTFCSYAGRVVELFDQHATPISANTDN